MAQQTAIEWLVRKLSIELIGEIPLYRWDEIREAVQQAKQIEKEQIKDAYYYDPNTDDVKDDGDHYYNETFGNK